jgi:hypothetical protein
MLDDDRLLSMAPTGSMLCVLSSHARIQPAWRLSTDNLLNSKRSKNNWVWAWNPDLLRVLGVARIHV